MKYREVAYSINALALGVEKKKGSLQQNVLSWAQEHPLRYAWREPGSSAYQVLIGEMLLEKLHGAVTSSYERFLELIPSVDDLLSTGEDEIGEVLNAIKLEQHRDCFRKLVCGLEEQGKRELPRDTDTLGRISGLPRHRIKAVFCFGYGLPIAVVDANVYRMLANIFAADLPSQPSSGLVESVAEALVCYYEPQRYNGALLDLAELVCRPEMPRCTECPMNNLCDSVPGVQAFSRTLVKTV